MPHFEAQTRLRFSFSLLHHTVIDTLSVLRFIVSFQDDRDERQFILQLTLSKFPVIFRPPAGRKRSPLSIWTLRPNSDGGAVLP